MNEKNQKWINYALSLGLDPKLIDDDPKTLLCLMGLEQNCAQTGPLTTWFFENKISPEIEGVMFSINLYNEYINDPKHYIVCGRISVRDKYFKKPGTLSSPVRVRIIPSKDGKEKGMYALGNDIVKLSELDQIKWMGFMISGDNYDVDQVSRDYATPY